MHFIANAVGLMLGLYDSFIDWCYPPTDFGKHGILLNRGDHFSPMTDDEMWDVMSHLDEDIERWWEAQFLRGYEQHGEGIFAKH